MDSLLRSNAELREQGIDISPANLKISDRATITMPYHVDQDGLEEARLAKTGAQFGSTKRGIAYAYGDKYMKKTLRMGDLLHLDDAVKKRLNLRLVALPWPSGGRGRMALLSDL